MTCGAATEYNVGQTATAIGITVAPSGDNYIVTGLAPSLVYENALF